MQPHFQTLANYNRWANHRLYAAAEVLSGEEYRENRGAFFHSVHGTLNHILVADRIWMRRITGDGSAPQRLDAVLYESLAELTKAREIEDSRIISFVDALTEISVAGTFTYHNTSGTEFTQALGPVLAHFFNHQTHHRGQVHALLTGYGQSGPELDLLYFLRES